MTNTTTMEGVYATSTYIQYEMVHKAKHMTTAPERRIGRRPQRSTSHHLFRWSVGIARNASGVYERRKCAGNVNQTINTSHENSITANPAGLFEYEGSLRWLAYIHIVTNYNTYIVRDDVDSVELSKSLCRHCNQETLPVT